ncbi:MAG: phosphatase PAP2 family protein [Chitinophagaceae bacterium]
MQQNLSYPSKNISTNIRQCSYYFGGLALLLFIATIFLFLTGKAGSFLSLNSYHPFALNVFFINYTFLGDGIFAICFILFFFYRKKKPIAINLSIAFIVSSIFVQLIKNLVNAPRPILFFEKGQYLFFIDGITHGGHSSFPSGHTATAFAMATIIVLFTRSKVLQLFILLAALLVGYSRIYLAQHFLIDVIIGSAIGCLSAILAVYLATKAGSIKKAFRRINNKNTQENEPVPAPLPAV